MTGALSGIMLGGALALSKLPGSCPSQAKRTIPGKFSSMGFVYPFQMAALSGSANLGSTSSSRALFTSLSNQSRSYAVLPSPSAGFMPPALFLQFSFTGLRSWHLAQSSIGLSNRCSKYLRRPPTNRKFQRARQTNIRSMAEQSEAVMEEMIKTKNSENAVVLYSKTWCPYCSTVKGLFNKLGVIYKTIELDELVDEMDVQDALTRLTNQTTVPNIFIGGEHIGGCDDTLDLHQRGELIPALKAAGATVTAA